MLNMSGSTHDSVHPPPCKFQRFFKPQSTSMYEMAPTPGHHSEPRLHRSKSSQSFNANKRLSSADRSQPGIYKARPSVGKGLKAHPKPSCGRTKKVLRREFRSTSRARTPAVKNRAPSPGRTSDRMSNPSIARRSLSPSFLDLTDSSESPPESSPTTSVSTVNARPRVERKRRPPPLILRDSFHFPNSQPPTLPVSPENPKAAPLTPMTLLTPISPQHRMPSEKEQFRRRLLKLQRTLGEEITPGLVVRPKPNSKSMVGALDDSKGKTTFHQRDQASLNPDFNHSPKTSTLCAPPALDSNFLENLPLTNKSKGDYLPETIALSPMTLTNFVGPPATPKIRPSLQFVLNYDTRESSSDNDDYDTPPVSSVGDDSCPPSSDDSYPPSPVRFVHKPDIDEANTVIVGAPRLVLNRTGLPGTPNTPGIRRKERRHGWSGEWNQPHIQVVIEKLRIL